VPKPNPSANITRKKAAKPAPQDSASVHGARIRERRKEMGLGLRELADATGLTPSFISLVERNRASASLDSLVKIASALDVPVFYFTRTRGANPVVRKDKRVQIRFPEAGLVSELLVPNLRGRLEMFISRGRPNTGNIARVPAHDSEECIYVVKGALKVCLRDGQFELQAGDSIGFHLSMLREIHVTGRREAVWITAITPPVL
jgi:transcriptional regulator with XRE-family HTH domain